MWVMYPLQITKRYPLVNAGIKPAYNPVMSVVLPNSKKQEEKR